MRVGEYQYHGNGELLENNMTYTVYVTDGGVEAYPEGNGEPTMMNMGTFVSLKNGNLEQVAGDTPMA